MSKLRNIVRLLFLLAAIASIAGAQEVEEDVVVGQSSGALSHYDDGVKVTSPDGRYLVLFSAARSGGEDEGKLWGKIAVRDLRTGRERTVRSALGQRGSGVFEGFSLYEESAAWSPDGRYLVYFENSCIDEPGVESGVVCHLHLIRFLQLGEQPPCRNELALERYGFGGWVRGRAHAFWQLNDEGRKVKRELCARSL